VTRVANLGQFMIWRSDSSKKMCKDEIAESWEESALSILAPLARCPVFLGSVAICTHHNFFFISLGSLDLFREEGLIIAGALCLKLTTPSVNHFYLIFVKKNSWLVFVGNSKLQCLSPRLMWLMDSCCALFCLGFLVFLLCCDRVSLMVACCCSWSFVSVE
jgi:hypothetical protein